MRSFALVCWPFILLVCHDGTASQKLTRHEHAASSCRLAALATRRVAPTVSIMKVRPSAPADAKAIAALIASFQPLLTLSPNGTGAEQYFASVSEEAELQYLQIPRYTYHVAERNDSIVGFIAMRDTTHLFHLFVATAYQRQGIARTLWCQALKHATQTHKATHFTVNSSLAAIPVYERFGFTPSGPEVQAHGIAFLPMTLKLKSNAQLKP